MAGDFLLALVVICWILWSDSRIWPTLFEGMLLSWAFVPIVSQVYLHIKIEHMPFLLERLVLRVAPGRIDGDIGTVDF